MKAITVVPGLTDNVTIREIERPLPGKGNVLMRVLEVGVCGTDREIAGGLYGSAPEGSEFLIPGHENLGIVEKGMGNLKRGDLVVATVRRPCLENCLNCSVGENDMCLTGNYRERGIKGFHGFMTEYYTEDPQYLVKVPPDLKNVAVLLEPLSILEKTVDQAFRIQRRLKWRPMTALVLGAGPIGLLATLILRDMGITTYTFARAPKGGLNDELVEISGAYYLSAVDTLLSLIPSRTGCIDLIIEATGDSALPFEAICILGTNGILALTGIAGQGRMLKIDAYCINMKMVLENKVVFGCVSAGRRHFNMGLKHLKSFEKRWPGLLKRMITRKVGIDGFKEALEKKEGDIKVVMEVTK